MWWRLFVLSFYSINQSVNRCSNEALHFLYEALKISICSPRNLPFLCEKKLYTCSKSQCLSSTTIPGDRYLCLHTHITLSNWMNEDTIGCLNLVQILLWVNGWWYPIVSILWNHCVFYHLLSDLLPERLRISIFHFVNWSPLALTDVRLKGPHNLVRDFDRHLNSAPPASGKSVWKKKDWWR